MKRSQKLKRDLLEAGNDKNQSKLFQAPNKKIKLSSKYDENETALEAIDVGECSNKYDENQNDGLTALEAIGVGECSKTSKF